MPTDFRLRDEHRIVTALLCDVVESNSIAEPLDAEDRATSSASP